MKRTFKTILAAVLVIAAVVSCEKEEKNYVSTVSVKVNFPSDFKAGAAYNGEVVLNDQFNTNTLTATAVNGVATFEKVPFGVYSASASSTISAADFQAIAPESAANVKSDISVNGFLKDITLDTEECSATVYSFDLKWSASSSLVISKIYNFGTLNLAKKAYSKDKYIEIYNNSDKTQYMDGLFIGEAYGSAVSASVYDVEADVVYLQRVVKFPGTGNQYPVEPGKSVVVAMNAVNHIDAEVITQTVDLSGADFECYVEGATSFFPSDNASVPNMEQAYAANTYCAKFLAGQGTIPVLFKMTDTEFEALETPVAPGTDAYGAAYAYYCKAVPSSAVLDAVDIYRKAYANRKGRHISLALDAAHAVVDQAMIAERKIDYTAADGRIVLKDTNNSDIDFVTIEPRTEGGADHLTPKDYTKPEIQ